MTRRLYLRQALLHLMVGDPAFTQYAACYTDYALAHDVPVPGKRVWWRYPVAPEGSRFHYVCFEPGEFRTICPDGPDDLVREAQPLEGAATTVVSRIRGCLEGWTGIDEIRDETTNRFIELGRAFVAQEGRYAVDPARPSATELGRRFLDADRGGIQAAFDDLYGLYFGLALPGGLFTPFLCLLQLQKASGLFLENDLPLEEHGAALIGGLAPYHPQSEIFARWAVELGNGQYAAATNRLRGALAQRVFERFQDDLFFAAHHFYAALLLLPPNAPPGVCRYTEQLADEGFACAQSGLALRWNVEEWQQDPLLVRLEAILRRDGLDAAEAEARRVSRPVLPTYPRHWAEVSLARAHLAVGGEGVREAALRLAELGEAMTPEDGAGVELDRIEDGLRVASSILGDPEQAKAYAARIVGRQLVRRTLGTAP